MIVTKNVLPYVVSSDTSVRDALIKANQHKIRVLFVVDENEILQGTLSSGDINDWLVHQESLDLSEPVANACNRSFRSVTEGSQSDQIRKEFTDRIDVLPILDGRGHLVSLAFRNLAEIEFGNVHIGHKQSAVIIAEIGNNHNGSVELAKQLVDEAINAGADCVKFQLRDMDSLYAEQNDGGASHDLGSQYVLDLLSKFNLRPEQMYDVFDFCLSRGITPLCTPWDVKSLEALERYGISAYKIASADLTNHALIKAAAVTGKPLIVSTGMSTEQEIVSAVQILIDAAAQFVLLHCNSTYPTPFKDINLSYMSRLKEIGNGLVGYSGHERGYAIPIAAVAQGANLIEKHFTLDRMMEGNDHKVSLLPAEFAEMVNSIRNVENALGSSRTRSITQGELMNRESLAKSLIASDDIAKGDVITSDKIAITSPGKGLQPAYQKLLIGLLAKRDMSRGDFFYPSDVEDGGYEPRPYNFSRPWGIPVRYHDYERLTTIAAPDLVEFHFSYKDLELAPEDWISSQTERLGYLVHAPELFANDHILDLADPDEKYAQTSLENMQKVIDVTRQLNRYFPSTQRPLIITNMGGFSMSDPMSQEDRLALYRKIEERLEQLDRTGVEIIPQTMPPFPWHFGGQRYHNLFVDPWEIREFCKRNAMRICLDVSHSKLACNHFNWSFKEFIEVLGSYTAHLHIVDAKGTDDEGLQIGDGDVDFRALGESLHEYCPLAGFIPEIWQGHKNDGEGFWKALEKLEGKL